jgi:paraquat-inducible protein B
LATPDGRSFALSLITGEQRKEEFKRLIDAGLRARLEVQSILTGLLYVDLDFQRSQPARLTGLNYKDMSEVPSIPPTVDEVLTTLEDVVRKIRGMPLEAMVDDLAATLAEFRRLVGSEETRRSQAALTRALENTQGLMARLERDLPVVVKNLDQTMGSIGQTSREFSATARKTQVALRELQGQTTPVLKAAETTLRDFSATAQETTQTVRELRGQTGPLLKSAESTLLKATEAMESTRDAAGNIAETTAADSSLQDAVTELRKSAQSLRQLTDYLERHPDAVLFGKSE